MTRKRAKSAHSEMARGLSTPMHPGTCFQLPDAQQNAAVQLIKPKGQGQRHLEKSARLKLKIQPGRFDHVTGTRVRRCYCCTWRIGSFEPGVAEFRQIFLQDRRAVAMGNVK